MEETCPYCDEETRALKNHVRLSSGDGHGPSGEYPEEFTRAGGGTASMNFTGSDEPAATDDGAPPGDDRDDQDTVDDVEDHGEDDDTVVLPTEELNEMLTTTAQAAREEGTETGFEAGYETAANELVETCPECGDELTTNVEGCVFVRHDGARATLEESHALCRSCDLLIPETGDPIAGSEHADSETAVDGGESGWGGLVLAVVLGVVVLAVGAVSNGGRNNNGPRNGPGVF